MSTCPSARKCAVCGKFSGAITGYRIALGLFGYDPKICGYAHKACIRRLQLRHIAKNERARLDAARTSEMEDRSGCND